MRICVGTVDSCKILHTALHRLKLQLGITMSHKLYMIKECAPVIIKYAEQDSSQDQLMFSTFQYEKV